MKSAIRARLLSGRTLTALVLVVGFVMTSFVAVQTHNAEQRRLAERMDRLHASATTNATQDARQYINAVASLAAGIGSQNDLTANEFNATTSWITGDTLKGATAVGFVVQTSTSEVANVQTYWRNHGNPSLTLVPSATSNDHLFAVLGRTMEGAPSTSGHDITNIAEPTAAYTEAKRSGRVTVSEPYVLYRDRDLPTEQQQLSFSIVAPVYSPLPAHEFKGWTVLLMRSDDFITKSVNAATGGNVEVTLSTMTHGTTKLVASSGAVGGNDVLVRRSKINIAQSEWILETRASTGDPIFGGPEFSLVTVRIIGGVAFTLLLGLLIHVLSQARASALAQVEKATADLRATSAELSAFAGMAAHDLKSPLASVCCYIELMRDLIDSSDNGAREKLREIMNRTSKVTIRMNSLIDELLALARARDGELHFQAVDLAEVARDVVNTRLERIELTDGLLPEITVGDMHAVKGDPRLFTELIDNLVGNALRYSRPEENPVIRITSTTKGDMVTVSVADNGIGVPVEDREAIFESFYSAGTATSGKGTGLGLSICKRIVERHGGNIWVTDNHEHGSRFCFTLPLARLELARTAIDTVEAQGSKR